MNEMDCTGGFKALRGHVAAAKRVNMPNCIKDERASDEIAIELRLDDEMTQAQKSIRYNQERLWEEEKRINTLRLNLVKEQRDVKERERSARSMERVMEEAMERISEKEVNLDKRIQEITRLEARLHEAIVQQQQLPLPVASAQNQEHHDDHERITALDQKEKELTMARDRVVDQEKHLATKERILGDKAAELRDLCLELERKDALRVQEQTEKSASIENELKKNFEALENNLKARFERETVSLQSQQEELLQARQRLDADMLAHKQTDCEYFQRTAELTVLRQQILHSQEQQMMHQEDLVAYWEVVHAARDLLKQDQVKLEQQREIQAQAETAVKLRERNLMLFAEQVEAQHQSNQLKQQVMSNEQLQLKETSAVPTPNRASHPSAMSKSSDSDVSKAKLRGAASSRLKIK